MIRFTEEGVFADTKEEEEQFYEQCNYGDPVAMAHLALYKHELEMIEAEALEEKGNGNKD